MSRSNLTWIWNNPPKRNYIEVESLKENHTNQNKRLILESQERFKSKKHNVFTEEVNKIVWIGDDDKMIMQSIHSIETYAYGTSKDF